MNESLYIKKFIKLSDKLCVKREDSLSKKKTIVNNKAAKELFKMKESLKNELNFALSVYSNLLKSDSSIVKIEAAVHCLNLKIHIKEAIKTLEIESKRNDIDVLLAFNAEMCLKVFNGEMPSKKNENRNSNY